MFIDNVIKRLIVFIIIILLINGSCSYPFARISNSIKKKASEKTCLMNQIRKDLYKQKVLNFINFEADTIYLISLWDYESGFIYGRIWNRKGSINYSYGQDRLQIRKDNYPFKEETLELINTWDKDKILVSQSKGIVLPSYIIKAQRVIIDNQRINLDTISFRY